MRIGLNAQLLTLERSYRGAGINAYIYNLLRQLARLPSAHRYSVFLGERRFIEPRLRLHYSGWQTRRPSVRILWEQLVLPLALRQIEADLLHAMAFVAPLWETCPFVVTVYDLSFVHYPQLFRPLNRHYLSLFGRRSARRARRVITISESTRQDVIRAWGVPPERVDVVYCGVDPTFRPLPPAQLDAFRRQHGLPEHFVLFLGTLEPRKNLDTLLEAYALWCRAQPSAPLLVIAGAKGWYFQHVFASVERLSLDDRVRFVGYVPAEELPGWYGTADVFIYPSQYEGFGLPVLEAMACGTPVITSDRSSLPEIAGDAGCLVPPDDTLQLAESMRQVWNDRELRQAMRERGLARAARFSWEQTAHQTVACYDRALSD